MKPRLVKPSHKSKRDLAKEVEHWQNLLNTDLGATTRQRSIYRLMRDYRQRQLDERILYHTDRNEYWRQNREARSIMRRNMREAAHRRYSKDET